MFFPIRRVLPFDKAISRSAQERFQNVACRFRRDSEGSPNRDEAVKPRKLEENVTFQVGGGSRILELGQ
jgi:hypothetical protein